jgi:hypothetical protein
MRYYGGTVDREEKEEWEKQAKKDGFDNLWSWLKWLARHQIRKEKRGETE